MSTGIIYQSYINLYMMLAPLVVLINGFLLNEIGVSIMPYYVLIGVSIFALKINKFSLIFGVFSLFYIFLIMIRMQIYGVASSEGLQVGLYFCLFLLSGRLRFEKFILVIWSMTFVLNSLFGLLGFGRTSYGNHEVGSAEVFNAVGIKGYYYAANELAFIIAALIFSWITLGVKSSRDKILLTLLFISLLLVGTKVAIGSAVILFCWHLYKTTNLTKLIVYTIPSIIFILWVSLEFVLKVYNRFLFFYEQRGLVAAIFSEREDRAARFLMNLDWTELVFGSSDSASKINYENDIINLVSELGIFSLIMVMYLMRVLYLSIGSDKLAFFSVTYLLILSLLSGHILFYAGPVLVLILVKGFFKNRMV